MAKINYTVKWNQQLESSEYPVYITCFHNKALPLTRIPLNVSKAVMERYRSNQCITKESREFKQKMDAELRKAQEILDSLRIFNFEQFRKLYTSTTGVERRKNTTLIKDLFDARICELNDQERYKTAMAYKNSYDNLEAFNTAVLKNDKDSIRLEDINRYWLDKYENWNTKKLQPTTLNTVMFYLRHLRAIYRAAIDDKLISSGKFPFGKGKDKYSISQTSPAKEFVTEEQRDRLLDYWKYIKDDAVDDLIEAAGGDVRKVNKITVKQLEADDAAVEAWFFSYYTYGANPIDFLAFHMKDVRPTADGNFKIVFRRNKTKRTTNGGEIIMMPELQEIIAERRNKDGYLLGIFTATMTKKQQVQTAQSWANNVNERLQRIAKKLGFPQGLNLSMARHSFASHARNHGVPLSVISQALIHNSVKTTEIYLSSVPDKQMHEQLSVLSKRKFTAEEADDFKYVLENMIE